MSDGRGDGSRTVLSLRPGRRVRTNLLETGNDSPTGRVLDFVRARREHFMGHEMGAVWHRIGGGRINHAATPAAAGSGWQPAVPVGPATALPFRTPIRTALNGRHVDPPKSVMQIDIGTHAGNDANLLTREALNKTQENKRSKLRHCQCEYRSGACRIRDRGLRLSAPHTSRAPPNI